MNIFEREQQLLLTVYHVSAISDMVTPVCKRKNVLQWKIGGKRTRATTDMSSVHADASSTSEPCTCTLLTSSSPPTSLRMLFAASCASCLAAVVLMDVDEPVSRRMRSLSSLHGSEQEDF